jgi:hypothetical protein
VRQSPENTMFSGLCIFGGAGPALDFGCPGRFRGAMPKYKSIRKLISCVVGLILYSM